MKDEVFRSFRDRIQFGERERFKTDYLVSHIQDSADMPLSVSDIVRKISRLITTAQYKYPKHAPLDAAYAYVKEQKDGLAYG